MKLTKKVIGIGAIAAALVATTVTTAVFGNVTESKSNYKVADVKAKYAQKEEKTTIQTKALNRSGNGQGTGAAISAAVTTIKLDAIVAQVQADKEKAAKAGEAAAKEAEAQAEAQAEAAAQADPWENVLLPDVDDQLNVREEASTDSEAVGILRPGCAAQVEEIGDEWTKITSGEVEGYVKNEYCVYGQDAKELAEEVCETTVTATTPALYVRETASTEATIVDVLEEEESLTADTDAEEIDGWVAVICDDSTAYVSSEYVDVELQLGTAVTIEEELARIAAEQEAARKAAEEEAAAQAAAAEAAKASQSSSGSSSSGSSSESSSSSGSSSESSSSSGSSSSDSSSSSSSESSSSSGSSSSDSSSQSTAVSASSDELTLLAALIYCEAGGECYEGQVAVGAVVMNRVRSGSFPNSIYDVIYQSGQFTPASSGALSSALANGNYCYSAAQDALAGADNTGGALYFRSGTSLGKGTVIGNQTFY